MEMISEFSRDITCSECGEEYKAVYHSLPGEKIKINGNTQFDDGVLPHKINDEILTTLETPEREQRIYTECPYCHGETIRIYKEPII